MASSVGVVHEALPFGNETSKKVNIIAKKNSTTKKVRIVFAVAIVTIAALAISGMSTIAFTASAMVVAGLFFVVRTHINLNGEVEIKRLKTELKQIERENQEGREGNIDPEALEAVEVVKRAEIAERAADALSDPAAHVVASAEPSPVHAVVAASAEASDSEDDALFSALASVPTAAAPAAPALTSREAFDACLAEIDSKIHSLAGVKLNNIHPSCILSGTECIINGDICLETIGEEERNRVYNRLLEKGPKIALAWKVICPNKHYVNPLFIEQFLIFLIVRPEMERYIPMDKIYDILSEEIGGVTKEKLQTCIDSFMKENAPIKVNRKVNRAFVGGEDGAIPLKVEDFKTSLRNKLKESDHLENFYYNKISGYIDLEKPRSIQSLFVVLRYFQNEHEILTEERKNEIFDALIESHPDLGLTREKVEENFYNKTVCIATDLY